MAAPARKARKPASRKPKARKPRPPMPESTIGPAPAPGWPGKVGTTWNLGGEAFVLERAEVSGGAVQLTFTELLK